MRRLAIVRGAGPTLRLGYYNIQEIGLSKALLELGWSVDIYSSFDFKGSPRTFLSNGTSALRLFSLNGICLPGKQRLFPGVFKFLAKGKYDVVQLQDDYSLMSQLLARWNGLPNAKIVLWQGMYSKFTGGKKVLEHAFDYFFGHELHKYIDLAVAKTNTSRKHLEKRGFEDVQIMPVGLDIDMFTESKILHQSVIDFRNTHAPVLLYVGKMDKMRNVDFFIDVLLDVRKHYPNAGALIVGTGPDEDSLRRRVAEITVEKHVLFTGAIPQNEMGGIYEVADILLLPTNHEIFGMVILEALYNGLPVLASTEPGPQEILQETYLGQCLGFDVKLWSDAACNYIEEDKRREGLRKAFVQENYSWPQIAKRYSEMLNTLVAT